MSHPLQSDELRTSYSFPRSVGDGSVDQGRATVGCRCRCAEKGVEGTGGAGKNPVLEGKGRRSRRWRASTKQLDGVR